LEVSIVDVLVGRLWPYDTPPLEAVVATPLAVGSTTPSAVDAAVVLALGDIALASAVLKFVDAPVAAVVAVEAEVADEGSKALCSPEICVAIVETRARASV
jgi:hypothetical protein